MRPARETLTLHQTQLWHVCDALLVPHSCRPDFGRIALAVAGMAAGVAMSIYFYLAIYLEYIAGIRLSWAVYAPNMIPTATAAGLICGLR